MEENFNVSKNVTSYSFGQNSIVETELYKTGQNIPNSGLYDMNSDVQSEVTSIPYMIGANTLPSEGTSNDKTFPRRNVGMCEVESRVKPLFYNRNKTKVYKSQISKSYNHENCLTHKNASKHKPTRKGPPLDPLTPTCQHGECLKENSCINVNHNKYRITDINLAVSNVQSLKAANPDNGGLSNELSSYQGKLPEASIKSSDHPTKVSSRYNEQSASICKNNGISGSYSACSAEICSKCRMSSKCSDLPTEALNNCITLPSQASSTFIALPFTAQSMLPKEKSPFSSLSVTELHSSDHHFGHNVNAIHKGVMHTPCGLDCHEKSTEANEPKPEVVGSNTVSQIVLTLEMPTNKVDENLELLNSLFTKLQTNGVYKSLTVRKSVEMSFICRDAYKSSHEAEMSTTNGNTGCTECVGEEKDESEYYTAVKVPANEDFDQFGLKTSCGHVCNSSQADRTDYRKKNKLTYNPTDHFGGYSEEITNMMKPKKDQIKYNFDFINPSQCGINERDKEMPDMDEIAASINITADNVAVSNTNLNGNKVQNSLSEDINPPAEYGITDILKNTEMHSRNDNLVDHKAEHGKVTADFRRNVDEEFNDLRCIAQLTSALAVTRNNAHSSNRKRKRKKKLLFCAQKRKYKNNLKYGKIHKMSDLPLRNISNKGNSLDEFSLQATELKQNNLAAKMKINRLIRKPTTEQRRYPKRQRVMMEKFTSPFEFYFPRYQSGWQNKKRWNVTEETVDNIPFKNSIFKSKTKGGDCNAQPKKRLGCHRNTENQDRSKRGAHSIPTPTRVIVKPSLTNGNSSDPNLINNHVDSKAYNVSRTQYEREVEQLKKSFVKTNKGTLRKRDLPKFRSKLVRLFNSHDITRSGLSKDSEQTCVNNLQHELVNFEKDKQVLVKQNRLGNKAKSKYQQAMGTRQFLTKDNKKFDSVTNSHKQSLTSLKQHKSITNSNKKASSSLNQKNSVTDSNRQSDINTIIPLDDSVTTDERCPIVGKVENAKLRKLSRKTSSSGRQLDLTCTTDQRSVTATFNGTICNSEVKQATVRGETCNDAGSNRVHSPEQGRSTRMKVCVYCRIWYSVPYIYTHRKTCIVNSSTNAKLPDGLKKRRMPSTCHGRKRQLPSKLKANLIRCDASKCLKNRGKFLKPFRKNTHNPNAANVGKSVNYASQSKEQSIRHLQCPFCNYKAQQRFCLKRHLEAHSSKTQVRCDTCNIIFKSVKSKRQWHTLLGIDHATSMPSKVLSVNSSVETDDTGLSSFKRSIRELNKEKRDGNSDERFKVVEYGNICTGITNYGQQHSFVCSEFGSSSDLASVRIKRFDMYPLLDKISENIGSKVVVKGKETIDVFEKRKSGEFQKTGYVIDIENALDDKTIPMDNKGHNKLNKTEIGFHEIVNEKKEEKVVEMGMPKESQGIENGKKKEKVLETKESQDLLEIREYGKLKETDIIANEVEDAVGEEIVNETGRPDDPEYFHELLDISWDTNIDLLKQMEEGPEHMPDITNLFTNDDELNDEIDNTPEYRTDITDLFTNDNESDVNNNTPENIPDTADICRVDIISATDDNGIFSHGNYSPLLLGECEDGAGTDNRNTSDRQGKGLSNDNIRKSVRDDAGPARNRGNKDGFGDGRKDDNNNNDDNGKPYSSTDPEVRNIELFSCLVCDTSFSRKPDLMKHLSRIHRLTNLCTLCYFKRSHIQRYSNPVTLRNHKVRDHRQDMVQCVCGTLLIDDKMLNSHLKKFKCNFQSMDNLKSVLIRCDCGKRFSNQELLTSHKSSKCRKRSFSLNKDCSDSIQTKRRRASATVTYNDVFNDSNNNEQKTNQQALGVANIKNGNGQDTVQQSLSEANIEDSNDSVCNENYKKSMAFVEDTNDNISVDFGNNSRNNYNLHKMVPVEMDMNTKTVTAEINMNTKTVTAEINMNTKTVTAEINMNTKTVTAEINTSYVDADQLPPTKTEDAELLDGPRENKPTSNLMSPTKAENSGQLKRKLGLTVKTGTRNAKPDSEGKYPCKVCGRRFKRPYLYVHQKQVHQRKQWVMVDPKPEVSRKKYKCGCCSFVSIYWRTIINHHYRLHQEMELDVIPMFNT